MIDEVLDDIGRLVAWLKDGDLYSAKTKEKLATVGEKGLYDLDGNFLNMHLTKISDGESGNTRVSGDTAALTRFKKPASL
jgi:hypothetical protein